MVAVMTRDTSKGPSAKRGDVAAVEVPRDERGRVIGNQAYVSLVGHRLRYWVRWASGPNGPEVMALEMESRHGDTLPITSADLRSIPLRKIAAAAARKCGEDFMTHHVGVAADPDAIRFFAPPSEDAGSGVKWSDLLQTPEPSSGRRRDLDDEHLRAVAQLARAAFKQGHKVRDVIAERYTVSVFTVDKWLAAARDREFLTPGELSRHRRAKDDQ